ncbi:hypothetical protein PoB_007308200 [Plakobranchus ocellatus]|uniref:Secreted protein n=1 Tax=Plakobranchus ocellatus TaxID=259542 RepID=A0AAV4DQI4_9GAST|nr:hypothetical protein PoB_007308200 [Plakobranchus ocellatus]
MPSLVPKCFTFACFSTGFPPSLRFLLDFCSCLCLAEHVSAPPSLADVKNRAAASPGSNFRLPLAGREARPSPGLVVKTATT